MYVRSNSTRKEPLRRALCVQTQERNRKGGREGKRKRGD